MNSGGRLNIQDIINSDTNTNINTNNNVSTKINASPVSLTTVLYKITNEGKPLDLHVGDYISKFKNLPISRKQSGYDITIQKVTVRGGRKKALVQLLPSTEMQNLRDTHKEVPNLVELSILVKKGDDDVSGSVVVYHSGIVTITMGVIGKAIVKNNARNTLTQQIEAVKNGVIQEFFPSIKGTGKFSNISGQFKFTNQFDVERLTNALRTMNGISDLRTPEPEMGLAAFRFKIDDVRCVLFSYTGTCQLLGATKLDQLSNIRDKLLSAAQTGAMSIAVAGPIVHRVKANKVKGRAKKLNINKRAPGVVRVGRLCPKSRRPNDKTGKCPSLQQFKRPNEQGDMCCYRLPKNITTKFKRKVIQSYKNFNKEVPKNVQSSLNITPADLSATYIEDELLAYFALSNNGRMMIKKRLCVSYTKSQLIEFATRIGLIIDPNKKLKIDICRDIYQEWRRQVGAGGGLNKIDILGMKRQDGHMNLKINDKKCQYWSRKNLVDWAKNHGIIVNPKIKKAEVCKLLYERANADSRFNSEINKRRPIVKIINNKVVIHNRALNQYSIKYLTWAAEKLKVPLPKNANISDITRRFYVKYILKPNVSVRQGKLKLMNRDANSYTRSELREIARKLPNVKISASAKAKQIINTIMNSTNYGKHKALINKTEKLPNNVRKGFSKKSFLTLDEKLEVVKLFPNASTTIVTKRNNMLKGYKNRLKNTQRDLKTRKRLDNLGNNNNTPNNININFMLKWNNIDEIRNDIVSLKSKIKRIELTNIDEYKLLKITDQIYDQLIKQKGFKGKYSSLSKANNVNMGAVSLAKSNIQDIVYPLVLRNKNNRLTKIINKKSPKKTNNTTLIRNASKRYTNLKGGQPSNKVGWISTNTGINVNIVRKFLNAPVMRSKVKSLDIEWFINGNRSAIRVKANKDDDINELTTKSRLKNDISKTMNRKWKQVTLYFKQPLSKTKDNNKALKRAEKKIRRILKRKVPSNVMYNI